jgi:hypothetical protein
MGWDSRLVNLGVGALMAVGGIWHIFPNHYLFVAPSLTPSELY